VAATDDEPSRADDVELTSGMMPSSEPTSAVRDATPSVTVVVVAHEPGEWFSETLDSIVTQDYPRVALMVVDAAGDPGLAVRVREVAPNATIIDASDTDGFAAAANTVLETDMDPAFVLLCHDDVALAPDVVRTLVTESLRSNAGITGPKLVEWEQPEHLQHVGLVVDRFAVAADVVDPAELDQEQYDAVNDVFAVPSACILIRTGLFRTLGGFDPAMSRRGDDVDLCWRAQLAGARVLVVPDASVRHREDMVERTGVDDVRRTRARHQLRTVLVTGGSLSLIVTLPAMMLLTAGEAVLALAAGRLSQVGDVLGAWTWNLARMGDVRRRRGALKGIRRVRFADIRALQQSGSVRINAFVRGQIGRGDGRLRREIVSAVRTGTTRFALIAWAIVLLFVLFGSRAFITGGVPAVGDFAAFPESSADLVSDWWNSWHDRDLGSAGMVPTGLGLLGVLGVVLGDAVGFVRTFWVLSPLLIGLLGAWRMLAVTGSRRAQIGALIAYAIVPLPWVAIASASSSGLIGYAAAPWLITVLLRAQASAPYRVATGPVRSLPSTMIGLGTILGLAVVYEPASILLLPVVLAGIIVGSLIAVHPGGLGRLLVVVVGGVVFAGVVALPQTLDIAADGASWAMVAEGRSGAANTLSLSSILRFSVGPDDWSNLVWALAVPLAVPLLVGRSWRFELAVRLWFIALASWGLVFVSSRGWLSEGLPDPALMLAPAAAAVAGLAGTAVTSVEHDLRTSGFGWRQALLPAALISAVLAGLPTLTAVETGRWGLGRGDFSTSLPFVDPAVEGSYRVVWLGDPSLLPAIGTELGSGLAWVATLDGLPTITDRHVPVDRGSADLLEDVIRSTIAADTSRAGRLFGGLGVRYVVLVERLSPAPFSDSDEAIPAPAAVVEALDGQLDLRQLVGVNSAVRIYENTEWTSVRSAVVSGFDDEIDDLFDLALRPLTGTAGVLSGTGESITGTVPAGTEVLVAQTPDIDWSFEVDGQVAVRRRALGWASAFMPTDGGNATLSYATPLWRRLGLVAQLLIFMALVSAQLRRVLGRKAL